MGGLCRFFCDGDNGGEGCEVFHTDPIPTCVRETKKAGGASQREDVESMLKQYSWLFFLASLLENYSGSSGWSLKAICSHGSGWTQVSDLGFQ